MKKVLILGCRVPVRGKVHLQENSETKQDFHCIILI